MPDSSEMVVLLLGMFAGSGLVTKNSGPYIFFYIFMPIISAIVMVFILEQIPTFGFDFQYDKYLHIVFHRQGDLVKNLAMGFAAGFALKWTSRRLFLDSYRARKGPRDLIDPKVSMERKKHLKVLGLNNSAGPRDILMAWTKISADLRDPNWANRPKNRNSGISAEDYKKTVDEAYAWLKSNSEEASQDRSARPKVALRQPWWKRMFARSSQNKVRIRGM